MPKPDKKGPAPRREAAGAKERWRDALRDAFNAGGPEVPNSYKIFALAELQASALLGAMELIATVTVDSRKEKN